MCLNFMVKHDDYMTPFSAWEDVSAYIPRHLTLWEAFYPPFENETKMTR